ncbi:MAG: hypothetical protein Q8868_04790 [Bacteroidota bacterium]|nr:hypothetical protein [Bacteroidota bacterium]
MILSRYNKFIFSIFSEKNDYLILTVYVLKFGKRHISFLQIHYSKTDLSGKYLPSFIFRSRLKMIDSSDRDIIFSKGRIIFKDDSVKVEFSSDLVMIYLNYSWDQTETSPLTVLSKEISGKEIITWNSFDFKSRVKGSMITPNNSADFTNVPGNIDLLKTARLRFIKPVRSMMWSRLHHQDVDLSYSSVSDKTNKSDSKLLISINKKILEFSDIQCQSSNEKTSLKSSVKYPSNILLTAKNDNYNVSVSIHDHSEVNINELINDIDFKGKLYRSYYTRFHGKPKELRLFAKADVVINNNFTRTEIHNINSISEYIAFCS